MIEITKTVDTGDGLIVKCVGWKLLLYGLVGVESDVRIVCNPETRATEAVIGYVTIVTMVTNRSLHEMIQWASMMQRGKVLSAEARCR